MIWFSIFIFCAWVLSFLMILYFVAKGMIESITYTRESKYNDRFTNPDPDVRFEIELADIFKRLKAILETDIKDTKKIHLFTQGHDYEDGVKYVNELFEGILRIYEVWIHNYPEYREGYSSYAHVYLLDILDINKLDKVKAFLKEKRHDC